MTKIKIVTDSTCDLNDDVIKKMGITVVPLSISINGENYLDRVDITPNEFIEKMKASPELPKSSQPPAGEFLKVYDELGSNGYEIISIHMTGGMSGTVRSAESAAQMTSAKVHVVDSRFISKALAFQVLEAAEMAAAGNTVDHILARLDQIREHTRLFVVVDTLENLVKGGRIGKGKALIGSLLNIKPIASLEGGEYTPVSKARSHTQVVKCLKNQFSEDVRDKTIKGVGLVHAEGMELAIKLKDAIKEATGFGDIDIVDTTPIISTHTGVGAIGFMYYFE
jgi:DegV family protein with EDD domain